MILGLPNFDIVGELLTCAQIEHEYICSVSEENQFAIQIPLYQTSHIEKATCLHLHLNRACIIGVKRR